MRRHGHLLVLLVLACHARAPELTISPAPAEGAPPQASESPAATEPALPRPGELAPELALRTIEGETVTLADVRTNGPVVLVFGSFT